MNYKHLESTCKETVWSHRVDGDRIITNGHIAFIAPEDFMPTANNYAKLGELWKKHVGTPPAPLKIGRCVGQGKSITRAIGNEVVQERFVRAFGDGVTWTAAAIKGDRTLLVHRNGDLIGLVMPMKGETGSYVWTAPPTDQQLFAPYACVANGWYLLDGPTMDRRIEETERTLSAAHVDLENAQDAIRNCEEELRDLRRERAAMEPVPA